VKKKKSNFCYLYIANAEFITINYGKFLFLCIPFWNFNDELFTSSQKSNKQCKVFWHDYIMTLLPLSSKKQLFFIQIMQGFNELVLSVIYLLVLISVDSKYLLTRVLTREYLFFDTFWRSSLLEFNLSLSTILERVEY